MKALTILEIVNKETMRPGSTLFRMWQQEFGRYPADRFTRDLRAGLTVAAVALPLALAFGVASGATAAAGLVTAIIGGALIGALSGAPYQISGPTGAMSAVLIVIALQHGQRGLWLAGVMAGTLILLVGLLRLGRLIAFIPVPVITGFTSGIAIIIFTGQIDNALGIQTAAHESAAGKLLGYLRDRPPTPSWHAIACAAIVAATMVLIGRFRIGPKIPAALIGIAAVTLIGSIFDWPVAKIGTIPSTIILPDRFLPQLDDLSLLPALIGPAIAIAALGAIESLLAGSVAGRMTGQKLAADQELVAQGIGNLVLPFFGGVPATAAIARMSVGVKAGGVTRMVSFVQSGALLISALFLGGMIGDIPLAALSGVLLVTAVRMNEWHLIRFYVRRRLKSPIAIMIVTMLATITFDLTRAIVIGLAVSLLIFVVQALHAGLSLRDLHRLAIVSGAATQPDMALFTSGLQHATPTRHHEIQIALVRGPISFLTAERVATQIESLGQPPALILALGDVPLIDASGIAAIERTWIAQSKAGHRLYLAHLQPRVHRLMERAGLLDEIGRDSVVPTIDEAIHLAHQHLTDIPSAQLTAELNEYDSDLPFGVVPVNGQ